MKKVLAVAVLVLTALAAVASTNEVASTTANVDTGLRANAWIIGTLCIVVLGGSILAIQSFRKQRYYDSLPPLKVEPRNGRYYVQRQFYKDEYRDITIPGQDYNGHDTAEEASTELIKRKDALEKNK